MNRRCDVFKISTNYLKHWDDVLIYEGGTYRCLQLRKNLYKVLGLYRTFSTGSILLVGWSNNPKLVWRFLCINYTHFLVFDISLVKTCCIEKLNSYVDQKVSERLIKTFKYHTKFRGNTKSSAILIRRCFLGREFISPDHCALFINLKCLFICLFYSLIIGSEKQNSFK